MEYAIKLREAVVLLGQFPALSGMDMEAEVGETVVITGPNGAGKTTLLRLLAGLLRISTGTGEVQGVDLAAKNLDTLHSKVGFLETRSMMYEDLTVWENLKFFSELWGMRESSKKVEDALNYLELSPEFWNLAVRMLSTGQKRRAAIALQVLRRPSLWLLDEPHAGLDKSGRDLLDEIIKNAAGSGACVVLASHEIERTKQLADKHLELVGGRVK